MALAAEIGWLGGTLVKTRHQRPCQIYQEFSFSAPCPRIHRITFRNYYCALLIVKQDLGSGESRWVEVLRKQLMADPHYEDDAQDWHVVSREEFRPEFDEAALGRLRFYLVQPSPSWLKFELQNIKFFAAGGEAVEEERPFEGARAR